ncbi:MAG: hypothetical protein M3041_07750 [Acidobacteriota bacterium]|nr:hypothetical protein [Acidobacteriota bacterium]
MNNGSNSCDGEFIAAIFAQVQNATVTNFRMTPSLAQCFDSSTLPIGIPFGACVGISSLGPGGSFTMTANVAGAAGSTGFIPIFAVTEVIDTTNSATLGLVYATNGSAAAGPTCTPIASVPPITLSGLSYNVTWSSVTDPNTTFTVEESTAIDFSTITDSRNNVSGRSAQFTHTVGTSTRYFYRVRANSCGGTVGPNSDFVTIAVQALPPATGRSADAVVPFGSTTPITIPVHIDPPAGSGKNALDVTFTASVDKPYLSVSPSTGTIPPGGTTINVTANPSNLPPGANTGTLTVSANGATIASKSVSVSLVTPVGPGSKSIPPSNALIIPAVIHAPGARGPFQSDVRLTNTSSSSVSYDVTFTPSGTDGTKTSKTTTVAVDSGQTIALNDIVKDFFGAGATDAAGDQGFGALELRPVNTGSTLNYASSRTFTFNDKGTFGQFIAAIPFSQFATKASVLPIPGLPAPTGNPVLSMQQVAVSSKFRTNIGLVEGSGTAASGKIRVLDDRGTLVREQPYSLLPGEHQQFSLASLNVGTLDDGRVEVTIESPTGAVSAYASVLDNTTNDPLAVTPVQVSTISATRYILPGMAAISGASNFHSDIRIYNGGTTQAQVTATFYPQGGGAPKTFGPFSIENGGVRAFDDVVASTFDANGLGGSILLTTPAATKLVATGRTYTIQSDGGTFGQFIPGVMPADGIGAGDRPLQILQLEESTNFRSNLGLVELSGSAAHVRITGFVPDSKTSVSTELDLAPNEFRQLGHVLSGLNLGSNVYNARIAVEVTGGSGRVASYGSVIDNLSLDPTYAPAQK